MRKLKFTVEEGQIFCLDPEDDSKAYFMYDPHEEQLVVWEKNLPEPVSFEEDFPPVKANLTPNGATITIGEGRVYLSTTARLHAIKEKYEGECAKYMEIKEFCAFMDASPLEFKATFGVRWFEDYYDEDIYDDDAEYEGEWNTLDIFNLLTMKPMVRDYIKED